MNDQTDRPPPDEIIEMARAHLAGTVVYHEGILILDLLNDLLEAREQAEALLVAANRMAQEVLAI